MTDPWTWPFPKQTENNEMYVSVPLLILHRFEARTRVNLFSAWRLTNEVFIVYCIGEYLKECLDCKRCWRVVRYLILNITDTQPTHFVSPPPLTPKNHLRCWLHSCQLESLRQTLRTHATSLPCRRRANWSTAWCCSLGGATAGVRRRFRNIWVSTRSSLRVSTNRSANSIAGIRFVRNETLNEASNERVTKEN